MSALRLQEHLTGLLHAESGLSVQIRCGLAAGEPIEELGDLFGIAVTGPSASAIRRRVARCCSPKRSRP